MCGELGEPWFLKKCSMRSQAGDLIDSCMVVFFKAPYSYTGQDVIEFHCHGNPMIVDLVLENALLLGAVVAEPGEFTKTAFLNDKIDLAQAESVADLINAQSESAVIAANSSLSGEFSKVINEVLDGLTQSRVFVEANIDFPEEEIGKSLLDGLSDRLRELSVVIEDMLGSVKEGIKLREGYSVAIVGPPNAGKSTLLNFLARENVAITSNIPGTTRDVVRVPINFGGLSIEFYDTAGVREKPDNDIEKEGINRSRDVIKKSSLSLIVQDASSVLPFNVETGESLTVMNKCDLLEDTFKHSEDVFYVSATSGEGVVDLMKCLVKKLGVDEGGETVFLSRKRHEDALSRGLVMIDEALNGLGDDLGLELIAENLKDSHAILGEILRPMSSDDILGEIFSEFCIGK